MPRAPESGLPSGDDPRPTSLEVAQELVYAPLVGEALNERAARRIAEAIGLGLLDVGDRLPAEAELAERFEIAPMTLRAALDLLRDAGYLETRRGRAGGNFVRAVHARPRPGTTTQRVEELSIHDLRDFGDEREAVEGAACGLVAQRATRDHIDELKELVESLADIVDFTEFGRLDRRFHITLAAASGSRRITQRVSHLQGELADILALAPHPQESLGITNGQHRAILAAVVEGDADGARNAMIAHIRDTTDYMIDLRRSSKRPSGV